MVFLRKGLLFDMEHGYASLFVGDKRCLIVHSVYMGSCGCIYLIRPLMMLCIATIIDPQLVALMISAWHVGG